MDSKDLLIKQLLAKIARLEQLVAEQAARIAALEKRLGQNSRNSSKPPSSDGLSKPPRTGSLREKGKNKSGGQRGHPGTTLKQVAHPDVVKHHALTRCPSCEGNLQETEALRVIKRQVFRYTSTEDNHHRASDRSKGLPALSATGKRCISAKG